MPVMHASPPTLPARMRLPQATLAAPGCLRHLWEEAAGFGPNGLFVHGQSLVRSGRMDALWRHMPHGLRVVPHSHEGGEPTLAQLDRLRSTARAARIDWVAAVGGGSVLDLGKAVAGLLHAEEPSATYHAGKPLQAAPVPFLAAPAF